MAVQVKLGRRVVLVGVGVVLAVLVAAMVVVQGGSDRDEGGAMAVAPSRSAPSVGDFAAEKSTGAGDGASGSGGSDAQVPGVPLGGVRRELVRTAQLTVEVTDPVGAVRQVRTAVAGAGGFVTEEESGETGSRLVLRVPAAGLDRLIDEVAGYGNVTSRSSQVLDATEQVVDLDARVASQTASVARVRALLSAAGSIGDVISIESELARREAELDSLTSRLAALKDQVALSTLSLDLRAPGAAPPEVPPAPGFLDGLAAGWDGLRAIGTATAAVMGLVLPFLPVLAVLGGFWLLARRLVRARRTPAVAPAGGRSGPGSEGDS